MMSSPRTYLAVVSLFTLGFAVGAGCAADGGNNNEGGSSSDGGSSNNGGNGGTAGTSTGTSEGGQGGGSTETGGGGTGSGLEFPCEVDCTTIQTPDCSIAVCNQGEYMGTVGQCVVVDADDGTSCDDGQFCTISDTCVSGVCTGGPQNDCGMAPAECEEVVCDEMTSTCSTSPLPNGATCDNPNDLCLVGETCQNGLCVGVQNDCFFQPVPNECFNSLCNPATGMCEPVPGNDGAPCTDMTNLCNIGNTCLGGQCMTGPNQTDCSFLTQNCDIGVCDPMTGVCGVVAVMNGQVCDDLDACTTGELCNAGLCGGGTPVTACSATPDGCCPATCNDIAMDPNFDQDCVCGLQDVLLEEVSTGGPDYFTIKNYCTQAVNIDPIVLAGFDNSGAVELFDMPNMMIQPNEEIAFVESTSALPLFSGTVINLGWSMGYEASPGYAYLCDGPCQMTGANIYDYVPFGTTAAPNNPPTGVNFTPSYIMISTAARAVKRQGTVGENPNFVASDWMAIAPTYQ